MDPIIPANSGQVNGRLSAFGTEARQVMQKIHRLTDN